MDEDMDEKEEAEQELEKKEEDINEKNVFKRTCLPHYVEITAKTCTKRNNSILQRSVRFHFQVHLASRSRHTAARLHFFPIKK